MDVAPSSWRCANGGSALQDKRVEAALEEVDGGGQTDRAAADDGDGQEFRPDPRSR
jgi:hypothetical protein